MIISCRQIHHSSQHALYPLNINFTHDTSEILQKYDENLQIFTQINIYDKLRSINNSQNSSYIIITKKTRIQILFHDLENVYARDAINQSYQNSRRHAQYLIREATSTNNNKRALKNNTENSTHIYIYTYIYI